MAQSPSSAKPPLLPESVIAAEQRARALLAQRKWRQARDEVKPLFKADRVRFLPLLIQANVGLIREMSSKGQVAEARQVMDYLMTIATPEQIQAAELELGGRGAEAPEVLAKTLERLTAPGTTFAEDERHRLIDQLVVAFQPLAAAGPEAERLAGEIAAIQQAVAAVSDRQWDRMSELLRPIARRSPVNHWVLFLKGLNAFFQGDLGRAMQLFDALPAASAPGRASQAYRVLAQPRELPKDQTPLTEGVIDGICRLLGQPAGGRWLVQAEEEWQKGLPVQSYLVLRQGLPQFPCRSLDWPGVLTELYFNAPRSLGREERSGFLDYLSSLSWDGKSKNGVEEMLCLRTMVLAGGDPHEIPLGMQQDWERFLHLHERLYGVNPQLVSLGYTWLGNKLSGPPAAHNPFGWNHYSSDIKRARLLLEQAMALDPQNLEAGLRLCDLYGQQRRKRERNRLLDQLVERFPQDKRVLILAAQHCFQRKAFNKGLDLLRRAQEVDRLDPTVPELILLGRRQLACQLFEQQRPEKARKLLDTAEPWLNDLPADLQRSRWAHWARYGALELAFGEPARAEPLLAQARAASPSALAFLFFTHLAHRVYVGEFESRSPWVAELHAELKRAPAVAQGPLLLQLLDYWQHAEDPPLLDSESNWVNRYLRAAAKHPFTRQEARELIERCGPHRFLEVSKTLVKRRLKEDPDDPIFRLFELMLETPEGKPPRNARPRLEAILAVARQRGDTLAIERVQAAIRLLDQPMPVPMDLPDDDEDDADWDPDFDADEGPLDLKGFPLNMPPEFQAEMQDLLEALRQASPAEVAALRRQMPKDVPPFLFEMMLELARSGGGRLPMPLPPAPPPRRRGQPDPPDPHQGELF